MAEPPKSADPSPRVSWSAHTSLPANARAGRTASAAGSPRSVRSVRSSRRRRALFALCGVLALTVSACAPNGPHGADGSAASSSPTGPVPGVARNAPMHAVDPARITEARRLPQHYPQPRASAKPTTVTVAGGTPGEDVRHGAVGVSWESTDLADSRLSADNDDLVSYLSSLNGPTVRFGGNSTDRRFFFTDSDEPTPTNWPLNPGEKITRVTPADLKRVAGLTGRSGASVILSVNLARYDPQRAGRFAQHAKAAFGDQLVGIMVGNEPNGFDQGRENPLTVKDSGWNPTTYKKQLSAYARAIHARTPHVPIVAPGAYSAPWWNAAATAPDTKPQALAVHQYPLSECGSRYPHQLPTVANAVDPATREGIDRLLDSARDDAAAHTLPLWVTETSLSACSGSNEITETLAAASYQAEYTLRAQRHGAQRVAVHSSLDACHGGPPMSVLCSAGSLAAPGEAFAPRANGLALALVASVPEGNLRQSTSGSSDLSAYTVDHGRKGATMLLIDYRNPASAGGRTVRIRLPFAVHTVRQAQLRGPAWTARYPTDQLFAAVGAPAAGPSSAPPSETSTAQGARNGATAATSNAASAAGDAPEDAGEPSLALSVEHALRQVGAEAVSVDGYGLPVTPPERRPTVAGVSSGARQFEVTLPAGSTTVLTLERATPGATGGPTPSSGSSATATATSTRRENS